MAFIQTKADRIYDRLRNRGEVSSSSTGHKHVVNTAISGHVIPDAIGAACQ